MAYAADQTQLSTQSNARLGAIVRFIWHHQAGTNDDATINAMVTGSRQVSATWTVSNTGRVTAVVPEERRPWTSASRADDGALTVECANITGPPDYGISDASHEACARLAAYALRAYGIPLQRATAANGWRGHMGHNEVVDAFGDGYATACPLHLDIDRIIALAADGGTIDAGGALQPTTEEDDMTPDQAAALARIDHALSTNPQDYGDIGGAVARMDARVEGIFGGVAGLPALLAADNAALIRAFVAAIPAAGGPAVTDEQMERALRTVLGSLA